MVVIHVTDLTICDSYKILCLSLSQINYISEQPHCGWKSVLLDEPTILQMCNTMDRTWWIRKSPKSVKQHNFSYESINFHRKNWNKYTYYLFLWVHMYLLKAIEDMRTLITMLFGGQDDGFCVISKSVQYLAIKLGHLMMGPLTHVTKDTKK